MATSPCASCGNLLEPGAAFCGSCGTPSAVPSTAPATPSLPPPPGFVPAPPGSPGYPAFVPSVASRPAVPVAAVAAPRPPVSRRNIAAGALALVAVLIVLVGTFLPIIQFDFNGANGTTDGWGEGLNDGPIHSLVLCIPLAMGILSLLNRGRILVKVMLILSAFIGFFWVAIRFADLSGSFDEDGVGAFVAQASDPGVGLYLILAGWVLVLIAGIVAKAGRPRVEAPSYGQAYPGVPPG